MNAITIDHLTKTYGKARGVTDLSFCVEQGDFFGYIGPNGAGKSTTIRALLGLISPTSGKAMVHGTLSDVGYLPSETAFYPEMRVRDVLKFSADLRKRDCSAEAKALCERLDLDPTRKVAALSLGNRKKVGIVCALQHRPSIYIMDEPTSGLDPLMQREFYSLLRERNQEGATVFLSSHVLSEVQRHCRHAALIREGRLMVCDSVEHLENTAAKRVTLRGVGTAPQLPGVEDVKAAADGVSFLYRGEPSRLLAALSKLPLTDVSIAEPDLEEIFMHYYERGERK